MSETSYFAGAEEALAWLRERAGVSPSMEITSKQLYGMAAKRLSGPWSEEWARQEETYKVLRDAELWV